MPQIPQMPRYKRKRDAEFWIFYHLWAVLPLNIKTRILNSNTIHQWLGNKLKKHWTKGVIQ